MLNFEYWNPVKMIFGKGQIAKLSAEIPKNRRILMIYGGGSIKKNEVYDQVKTALKDYTVLEFGGIEPNPHYETLMKAVEMVKAEKIDFLLAVGGGSVLDGTKFIAMGACCEGDPWDIWTRKTSMNQAISLASVLTLPATGSEMNCGSVVTKFETREKLGFGHPLLFPQFSILDPETTYSLPPQQTANGIIDAFVHVVEQYITPEVNSPLQDRIAEGILLTLIEEGPKALQDPTNYDVRANIMWCATMALNGVFNVGMPEDWEMHLIGHELTAKFNLDHGVTLAIVLPALWHKRKELKRKKLLKYAERVWGIHKGDAGIDKAIEKTREFFESLGVKTYLSDYDIDKSVIPELADRLMRHKNSMMQNRDEVTLESTKIILEDCI
ncbi:MAG: aldehyde reductase [Gammaproteobacteria bacterium RIFCSPLOWO2_02_FULL_42_9]|nr:MAG: aldehyde reductase [Gammaproteobacteria bacterium RIFCSPLOWO2_02_FULL_42_9]